MSAFTHLLINSPPTIQDSALLNLGRINVICGKNNSGKSTLLKTLLHKDRHKMAKVLTSEELSIIFEHCREGTSWGGRNTSFNDCALEIMESAARTRTFWLEESAREFTEAVQKARKSHPKLAGSTINSDKITAGFLKLFSTAEPRVVLIPPKRMLDTLSSVETMARDVLDDGRKLLGHLFHLKNQPPNSSLRSVFDAICEAFTHISGGYCFDIFSGGYPNIGLKFSRPNEDWVPADDCGLGLQDLIVLLFFAIAPEYDVVLIEEPESHLHPDMQRKLLYFLRENTEKQFFLTTHSNLFLNNAMVDKVLFTIFNKRVNIDDATSRAAILNDLGYSVNDNLVSDLVILVEGPKDVGVIEELLIKVGLWDTYDIKTWPLGGDIMSQVDLSVFAEKYKLVALIDNDPGSDKIRKKFVAKCKEFNIPVSRLKRYAIENYFSVNALKTVFKGQIPDTLDSIDPDRSLEDQLGMNVKNNNRRLMQQTALDDLKGSDLLRFIQTVERICKE